MTYTAPVAEIKFALESVAGFSKAAEAGLLGDVDAELVDAILEEAGKFATNAVGPLNRIGDAHGASIKDGVVSLPPEWSTVYQSWIDMGWGALSGPESHGGQGLPTILATAVGEMINGACLAFALNPLLTAGATEALAEHGSDALKELYLEKMVSGEWTGTMNLTEPQAGSDLSALRTRAEPQGDGTYRIFGQKIYITYGEHELTDNIVHLVLARLPDAPAGTRGISLFLVPKVVVNADGSLGARNDVFCNGIEHKLGIHASPTCTMIYGDGKFTPDGKTGAVGYLIGSENRGLNCMFTMMNNARLAVAVQGVGIAEHATQQARAYAEERRQGTAPGGEKGTMDPIIAHPDVRRNLRTMEALTAASRALCMINAREIDISRLAPDAATRAAALERANILTPVSKAFATDAGCTVASIGVQVHGGMGFVEETGAAQHLRDARILPIYEGTNGIQAIDLVTRKIGQSDGAAAAGFIAEFRAIVADIAGVNTTAFGHTAARLSAGVEALSEATDWLLAMETENPAAALAGATPYLRLFGLVAGGAWLAKAGLRAMQDDHADAPARITTARFFAEHQVTEAPGLASEIVEGADSVVDPDGRAVA